MRAATSLPLVVGAPAAMGVARAHGVGVSPSCHPIASAWPARWRTSSRRFQTGPRSTAGPWPFTRTSTSSSSRSRCCTRRASLSEDAWVRHARIDGVFGAIRDLVSGKPTLLLCGHCGNWEALGYIMALLGFPMHAVYRPLDMKPLDQWVRDVRGRRGLVLVDKFGAMDSLGQTVSGGRARGLRRGSERGRPRHLRALLRATGIHVQVDRPAGDPHAGDASWSRRAMRTEAVTGRVSARWADSVEATARRRRWRESVWRDPRGPGIERVVQPRGLALRDQGSPTFSVRTRGGMRRTRCTTSRLATVGPSSRRSGGLLSSTSGCTGSGRAARPTSGTTSRSRRFAAQQDWPNCPWMTERGRGGGGRPVGP
jgi:hypothetical protein